MSLDFKLGLVSGLCIGIAFCSIFLTIAILTIRNYGKVVNSLFEDLDAKMKYIKELKNQR